VAELQHKVINMFIFTSCC